MIILASKQEKELLAQLRNLQPVGETAGYAAEVIALKQQIADLEITKGRIQEAHEKQERQLRHEIGLEKNRQKVELEQAKKEASLTLREGNLAKDEQRFAQQLAFNTERFQTMETYLKETLGAVLERLPHVNVDVKRKLSA